MYVCTYACLCDSVCLCTILTADSASPLHQEPAFSSLTPLDTEFISYWKHWMRYKYHFSSGK